MEGSVLLEAGALPAAWANSGRCSRASRRLKKDAMPILEPMISRTVFPSMRSGLAEGSEDRHVIGCFNSVAQMPRRAAAKPFTTAVLSPNLAGNQARFSALHHAPLHLELK